LPSPSKKPGTVYVRLLGAVKVICSRRSRKGLGEVLVSLEVGPAKLRVIGCHFLSSPVTVAEAPTAVEANRPTAKTDKAPTIARTIAAKTRTAWFKAMTLPLSEGGALLPRRHCSTAGLPPIHRRPLGFAPPPHDGFAFIAAPRR
jgi:hypothetical protein